MSIDIPALDPEANSFCQVAENSSPFQANFLNAVFILLQ